MVKKRIIIVVKDEQYAFTLLHQFMQMFRDEIDIEMISNKEYFSAFFDKPQKADILLVSEEFYRIEIAKHCINHVFVMTEKKSTFISENNEAEQIYKYSNLMEIFSTITASCVELFSDQTQTSKGTKTILIYSACGGAGKTTIALGLAVSLSRFHKRVLYLDAEYIQSFQFLLGHQEIIPGSVASKLQADSGD